MDDEFMLDVMKALRKAKEAYYDCLSEYNLPPLLKLEVRELRNGDFSLGISITIDEIKEHVENLKRNSIEKSQKTLKEMNILIK